MESVRTVSRDSLDELLESLGARLKVESSTVVPFSDYADLITALLKHVTRRQARLLVAGHLTPDVAIAADRAEIRPHEVLGLSPFVSHPEDILEAVESSDELIYLANPSWVTGSGYSFAHLDRIAHAIPDGLLILDEKYFDYYGITGLPLLDKYQNIVVIRSMTAGFSIGSDQSGYMVGTRQFVNRFRDDFDWSRITTTRHRLLTTSLTNEQAVNKRLAQVHNESLRIATALTRMKVQNRITATDYILLRVADTKTVGNQLATSGTPVENLEGYPALENYLRYRIQSPLSNDSFLNAFKRMSPVHYLMDDLDKRAVMFHRAGNKSRDPRIGSTPGSKTNRKQGDRVLAAD